MTKTKVFLYIRKSSEGEDRQILSLDSQKNELKIIAKRLNLEITEIFEEAKSAKKPGRPIFNQMMERLYKKEVEGILCWKLDRLARNPIDGGSIIWAIKDNDVKIFTPSQQYSKDQENTLLMYVEFGMAQKFIDDLGKNAKRGMKTKAEMGWFPQYAPLGYLNAPSEKKGFKIIKNDPNKFDLIKKAFQDILNGVQANIVYEKAKNEWSLTGKSGKPISTSSFYYMISNPFYCGEFEWPKGSNNWYKGNHEAMITKDEFNIIQKMLGNDGRPIAKSHIHDLTGLMRCGECGYSITATKKTKYYPEKQRTAHYTYYHCSETKKKRCKQPAISEKQLEKQVDEWLIKMKPDIKFMDWAKRWLSVAHEKEYKHQEIILENQQREFSNVEKQLNRLLDGYLNGLINDEEIYKRKKNELESQKEQIKQRLNSGDADISKWRKDVENALDLAYTVAESFKNGDRAIKQKVLIDIGSNFTLKDKVLRIDLFKHFEILSNQENWEEEYSDWVEPPEYTDILTKTPDLRPTNPTWLSD